MADIDITIGAQDQASKILEDVNSSTGNLTRAVSNLGEESQETGSVVSLSFKSIAGIAAGFTIAIGAAKAAGAAFQAVGEAIAGMRDSVDAFQRQEAAARGMTDAQLEFAASMQIATGVADESTLSLMRYAEAIGATKDNSDEMVLAAESLAAALGDDDAKGIIKDLTEAMLGDFGAMEELLPALRNIEDEQEKLAVINAAVARGYEGLQAKTESTTGVMQRSATAFNNLSEQVGALFEPIFRVTHQGLAIFAETVQTAMGPAVDKIGSGFAFVTPFVETFGEAMQATGVVVGAALDAIVSIASTFGQAIFGSFAGAGMASTTLTQMIDGMARAIITAITAVEVIVNNLGSVFDFGFSAAMLAVEGLRADFAHTFTVEIPAFATWFAQNFTAIMGDAFNAVAIAFGNMALKVIAVGDSLISWLKSGMTDGALDLGLAVSDALSGSLLEGFEATTAALPEIAGRAMTDTEKELSGRMGAIGSKIVGEFNETLGQRVSQLDAPINAQVELDVPDLAAMFNNQMAAAGLAGGGSGSSELQAQESRLLTRGSENEPLKKIEEYEREQLRLAKEQKEIARQQLETAQAAQTAVGLTLQVIG